MLIWQLAIIQIVTFILIVLFLRWLLHSQISRAVLRLKKLNKENREREQVLKEETERTRQEIEREIEEGKQKAQEAQDKAKEEAEQKRRDIIYNAKEEAGRIIQEGKKDVERNKKDFILDMQNKAVFLATKMVEQLLTKQMKQALHRQFVDEIIKEVQELPAEKLKTEGDSAEVVSICKLDKEQTEKIKSILSSKINRDVRIEEKVDENLVAGLLIKLEGFSIIDGTTKARIKKILPLMKEEAKQIYQKK
jgi:F-type H+-transporting ATPase subunit b